MTQQKFWQLFDTATAGFLGAIPMRFNSVALVVLVGVQVVIFSNLKPRQWFSVNFFRELIVPGFVVDWQISGIGQFAVLSVVWGLILCLGPLAQFVASWRMLA